jgi:hypothetical protein
VCAKILLKGGLPQAYARELAFEDLSNTTAAQRPGQQLKGLDVSSKKEDSFIQMKHVIW